MWVEAFIGNLCSPLAPIHAAGKFKLQWKSREHPTVSYSCKACFTPTHSLDERLRYAARTDDEDILLEIFNHPGSFDINATDGCVYYRSMQPRVLTIAAYQSRKHW
jgi:hypothetical protein